MNDDIGAHLRIIHRAGCTAPSVIAALPFATAMGRNPAIDLVADGKGGELFRCRLCGMREGEASASAPTVSSGPEKIASRAEVERIRDRLLAEGKRAGYTSIAKEGGWSGSTVRRRLNGN